jgi:hypothetical protein
MLRYYQAQHRLAAVNASLQPWIIARVSNHIKIAVVLEFRGDGAALRAVVRVVYHRWDAVYIERKAIAEKQNHQYRQQQSHGKAAGIPDDVQEFLLRYRLYPSEVHDAARSSFSIRATKTSSIDGSMASSRRIAMPLRSSAARM